MKSFIRNRIIINNCLFDLWSYDFLFSIVIDWPSSLSIKEVSFIFNCLIYSILFNCSSILSTFLKYLYPFFVKISSLSLSKLIYWWSRSLVPISLYYGYFVIKILHFEIIIAFCPVFNKLTQILHITLWNPTIVFIIISKPLYKNHFLTIYFFLNCTQFFLVEFPYCWLAI